MYLRDKRVYIPVSGSGLGHASRMLLAADKLHTLGLAVAFSTSGEAVELVRSRGFECFSTYGLDVGWSAQGGFAGMRDTLRRFPKMIRTFLRQVNAELVAIKRVRPNLVISDSRLSAVIAARMLRVECVAVLNQLRILLPPSARSLLSDVAQDASAELLSALWSLGDSVLLADLPPPYTISELNLWNVRSAAHKAQYIGFLAPQYSPAAELVARVRRGLGLDMQRPIVFAHVSGPAPTKRRLLRILGECALILERDFQFVISAGAPGASTQPSKIIGGWYFAWCPFRDELYSIASTVVIRGGHSSIAQSILTEKPPICIPIPDHSEQLGNSGKVQKLGVGLALDQGELTPRMLAQHVTEIVKDEARRRRIHEVSKVAKRFDGVAFLQQYASRLLQVEGIRSDSSQ